MIQVSPFLGMVPKISDRLIPDQHATLAEQCELESMSLKPARAGKIMTQMAYGIKSIYRHPLGDWFRWGAAGVKAVQSPLNDDVWNRIYWTGDGPPKMIPYANATSGTPPSASYRLGIPEPTLMLMPTKSQGELPEDAVEIDTVYTYTYVSEFGEEGPPAPPSGLVTRFDGGPVELTGIKAPPSGPYKITTKRIYRSETGGTYLHVADIPVSATTFSDNVSTENLGPPLESLEWDMPDGRMQGLTNLGNGILAGFFDNTLCFCEPYRPHAWPVGYQLGFESSIVGISPVSGGLVVVTQNAPWLVGGASPAAMSQSKLDVYYGGVSTGSVVDMGEYAIYASDEGLVAIGGNQSQLITQDLISRDQWQEYNPSSINAFRWRDKYLAFYETKAGVKGSFILHQDLGIIHYPSSFGAGYLDTSTGEVYISDNSGRVTSWGLGEAEAYTWKSKEFTLPQRTTMPVCKVDGIQSTDNPVNLKIWVDGTLLINEDVIDTQMIRLPSGRYRYWQFQLVGTAEVFSLQIASSPAFLR